MRTSDDAHDGHLEPVPGVSDATSERTPTSLSVAGRVAAPPAALWAVLSRTDRHVALDGSGMVRAAGPGGRADGSGGDGGDLLEQVGQVFVMGMSQPRPGLEDYRTANRVTALEPERLVAWAVRREGHPEGGMVWSWRLEPAEGGAATDVVHTQDWTGMTDPAVLARVSPPRVTAEEMAATLGRLAAAAGDAHPG